MRPLLLALAIALAFGGRETLGADDEPASVEASLAWEPGRFGGYRAMFLPLRSEPVAGVGLPADLSEGRFARIRWGGGRGLACALDLGAGRERLWLDTDLDGDLRDETPLPWGGVGEAVLRVLDVLVAYDGEEAHVSVRLSRAGPWDADRVQIVPWAYRTGFTEAGGRLRAIHLVDDNADLRFDDPERDRVYLDVDGDGRIDVGREQVQPGAALRLGDEGWTFEVPDPSGARVVFRRTPQVPPAPPATWTAVGRPATGVRPDPPAERFEDLKARIERERDLAYLERLDAVRLLGAVGSSEAFDLLHDLAEEDRDVSLRAAAARALGNAAYADLARRVVDLTRDAQPGVAAAAVDALHAMGYEERESAYVGLLKKAPAAVAAAAARNLGYLATPSATRTLLDVWRTSDEGVVRYGVYQGLRTLEEGPPPDVIREAVRDAYEPLRGLALKDLWDTDRGAARVAALEAARVRPVNLGLARSAVEVLGWLGDEEAVRALLELAADLTGPLQSLQSDLERALAPLRGDGAVRALIAGLLHKSPSARMLAAVALGDVVRPAVAEALLARARREKDGFVLGAVLEALGDQQDPRAIDSLLKYAKKRDREVRLSALRALGRLGLGDERVRRFFVSLLLAREWEDRVMAIDAAAASGDRALASKVMQSLDHDRWPVRLAAVQALGRLRAPEAIEPLIERLEREDEPRLRDAVARALFLITGMNLYDEVDVWRRWWKEQPPTYRVPDEIRELPAADAGGTQAGFYGIPVRTSRVIFVIDQSGSMSAPDAKGQGTRLEVAIREVEKCVRTLSDGDRVNVILFHSTVQPWEDRLQRLSSANRKKLAEYLDDKQPMGGTNLYDALEAALVDPDVDTVFLLSDGVPGQGKYVATEDILRAVRRTNQTRRIQVHAISIGMDSALLRHLAAENDGQYLRR